MVVRNWKKSEQFHLVICLTVKLKLVFLQLDELWSYCLAKYHKLWVLVGFEASTKFWINFELGSRTQRTAYRLVTQIRHFYDFSQNRVLRVTTDKFAAYPRVLAEVFVDIPYR
jgi:IS1 family transposase